MEWCISYYTMVAINRIVDVIAIPVFANKNNNVRKSVSFVNCQCKMIKQFKRNKRIDCLTDGLNVIT